MKRKTSDDEEPGLKLPDPDLKEKEERLSFHLGKLLLDREDIRVSWKKDTSTWHQQETGIEPPTLWIIDDSSALFFFINRIFYIYCVL